MLRKILFVDDDLILRRAAEKHLAACGEHFSTVTAIDGFDAVQKLKKMPFSLVVLDLIMPRMDGMSLINHIRDKYPDIPILIISGMPIEQMHRLASASGIVGYLSKPFQADELVNIIMNTLRKEAEGGIMHDVSPAVFLQFMEMDAKTCTIRILDKASKEGGILHFIDGQLVDARIGELRGMDAALKVFTWDAATIFLRNECAPREDTINSGLQPIIMKAAGMKDESEDPVIPDDEDSKTSPHAVPDTLDDLVLPNDFPAALPTGSVPDGLPLHDDGTGEEQQLPWPLEELRNLLEKAAEIQCGRDDIYHDEVMDKILLQLNELGLSSQFGNFQAGYIATGKATDRILLPGPPAIIARVPPNCPQDKILQLLRNGPDTSFRR